MDLDFWYSIALDIMSVFGLWLMFKKFKMNPWWSLVPVVRRYIFAAAVDREEDGKIWCIIEAAITFFSTILLIIDLGYFTKFNQIKILLSILLVFLMLLDFVYLIRIGYGLCKKFNRSRRWIVMWLFADELMLLIWGASSKFVIDEDDESDAENIGIETDANSENGITGLMSDLVTTKSLKHGLDINIRERKVRDGIKYKYLLKDIRMQIKPGRMVLLLGGSGAGKTTFLNALNGYEPADADVLLDKNNIYQEFDHMKYEIGFVPQQDLIRYKDTVYKTLDDAAKLRLPNSFDAKKRRERVEEVLKIFGLGAVKKNLVEKQSGGQKKRISIATEFISDPNLFILDEPDSGLDGIMARDLMTRLHEISRQGKIVIVITHTPDRVIDLFDDVIVLAKDQNRTGRLVFYGPIDEAKDFFGKDTMEDVVKTINREEEGGEGRADELIEKYEEIRNNGKKQE